LKFVRTEPFKEDYQLLPNHIQQKTDKTLLLLSQNLRHPSLQVKKIKGREGIFEARVDLHHRLTFSIQGGALILRAIGTHNKVLKSP